MSCGWRWQLLAMFAIGSEKCVVEPSKILHCGGSRNATYGLRGQLFFTRKCDNCIGYVTFKTGICEVTYTYIIEAR